MGQNVEHAVIKDSGPLEEASVGILGERLVVSGQIRASVNVRVRHRFLSEQIISNETEISTQPEEAITYLGLKGFLVLKRLPELAHTFAAGETSRHADNGNVIPGPDVLLPQ